MVHLHFFKIIVYDLLRSSDDRDILGKSDPKAETLVIPGMATEAPDIAGEIWIPLRFGSHRRPRRLDVNNTLTLKGAADCSTIRSRRVSNCDAAAFGIITI